MIKQHSATDLAELSVEEKIYILEDAGTMLGMYPKFEYHPDSNNITFKVNNCPFKEVVEQNKTMVCNMHHAFLEGMFTALFTDIELISTNNMFDGCINCQYVAKLTTV